MKKILTVLIILISVSNLFSQTSQINETEYKIISIKDKGVFDNFNYKNKVGVAIISDNIENKKVNYLLIYPKNEIYKITNGVPLNIKQTQDFISTINKAIEKSKSKAEFESIVYITFLITPKDYVKQINNKNISFENSLKYTYQIKGKKRKYNAEISINDVIYYHDERFINLLEKGYEELLKLENVK